MKKAMTQIARMFHDADPSAQFLFRFWDGEVVSFGAKPVVSLHMKTERSAENILSRGFMGFGESYMSGEVEVYGDLQELMRLGFAANFDGSDHLVCKKLRDLLLHLKNRSSLSHASQNISYHYDRGDEFYRLFLDETALALLLINPQSDDPFAEAGDWLKALDTAAGLASASLSERQGASRRSGTTEEPAASALRLTRTAARLLIFSQIDVGGMKIGNAKIERFIQEHRFAGCWPPAPRRARTARIKPTRDNRRS